MENNTSVVRVVYCAKCVHNYKGRCEMWEMEKVTPSEFCAWGRTADGEFPEKCDVIPVEWIENYAKIDDKYGSIYRMMEEWGQENATSEKYRNKVKLSSIYGEMKGDVIPISFLEELCDKAQNEEAALMIEEIIAQWRTKNAKR